LPEAEPSPRTLAVLRDAETYFTSQLAGSWAPGNLADRRISEATARDWHIEKSPGWGVHAAMVGGVHRLASSKLCRLTADPGLPVP
jgi:hypothetical protein